MQEKETRPVAKILGFAKCDDIRIFSMLSVQRLLESLSLPEVARYSRSLQSCVMDCCYQSSQTVALFFAPLNGGKDKRVRGCQPFNGSNRNLKIQRQRPQRQKSKRFLSLKFIDLHQEPMGSCLHRSFKIELKHTYGIHTKRHKDPLLPNSLANRGGHRKI